MGNDTDTDTGDLTVGIDGAMTSSDDAVAIKVKTAPDATPEVNEVSAPPPTPAPAPTEEAEPSSSEAGSNSDEQPHPIEADENKPEKTEKNAIVATEAGIHETQAGAASTVAAASGAVAASEAKDASTKQSVPHEHRNNKKFAAVITVVVALLFAGAAVFIYVSAEDNAQESTQQAPVNDTTEQADTPVTPSVPTDVDQTSADVDAALEALDDTADFSEDELSDDSLGL